MKEIRRTLWVSLEHVFLCMMLFCTCLLWAQHSSIHPPTLYSTGIHGAGPIIESAGHKAGGQPDLILQVSVFSGALQMVHLQHWSGYAPPSSPGMVLSLHLAGPLPKHFYLPLWSISYHTEICLTKTIVDPGVPTVVMSIKSAAVLLTCMTSGPLCVGQSGPGSPALFLCRADGQTP